MLKRILLPALAAFVAVACAHGQTNDRPAGDLTPSVPDKSPGRLLFLRNCAHCHGADAHGDDGPDLHGIDWTDAQIGKRIRTGKAGQMTAFEGKLTADQINQLTAYVQTLK